MKNGDFPDSYVCLPEGTYDFDPTLGMLGTNSPTFESSADPPDGWWTSLEGSEGPGNGHRVGSTLRGVPSVPSKVVRKMLEVDGIITYWGTKK
jgi:hypothetical protein